MTLSVSSGTKWNYWMKAVTHRDYKWHWIDHLQYEGYLEDLLPNVPLESKLVWKWFIKPVTGWIVSERTIKLHCVAGKSTRAWSVVNFKSNHEIRKKLHFLVQTMNWEPHIWIGGVGDKRWVRTPRPALTCFVFSGHLRFVQHVNEA